MDELMITCGEISDNRKKQIKIGFEAFKSRQNNVFSDPDIKTGQTVKAAIGADIKKHEKATEELEKIKEKKNQAKEEQKSALKNRTRAAAGLGCSPTLMRD